MSSLVVWLDRKKAHLFHLSPQGLRREVFRAHGKVHPREAHGRNHSLQETDAYRFYRELADRLSHYNEVEWLLLGPGLARVHFQRYIEEHRPELLSHIVGSEVMPPGAESGILRRAGNFFRRFRIFQGLLPGSLYNQR